MIYVYGIGESSSGAPALPGLDDAPLQVLDRAGVAAVYSRHAALHLSVAAELVFAHERVVEAMLARGSVLPLRFGTRLDSEERLARELAQRRDELVDGLRRVRGRVEVGVRILRERSHPADAEDRVRSGRDYLLSRAAEQRRASEVTRDLHEPLAERADASVLREYPAPPDVMVGTYLLPADRATDFSAYAEALGTRHADMRAHVTGPWPPYNFVSEGTR
ncbi:MAG: hypothetical protein GEV07_10695 [Streptosporangiales bacterium]|nr:hypothetical protein [Streptosporangiales bacterium]